MAATKATTKLLVDKKNNKVLFGEASKKVVDFLFNILSLPVGTVVRLLSEEGMVGCVSNLYKSVESLSNDYMKPKQNKDSFLNPKAGMKVSLLSLNDSPSVQKKLYTCSDGNCSQHYMTDQCGAYCYTCHRNNMNSEVMEEQSSAGGGGLVKGVVTYMVMDDLVVQPMSTISSIAMLNEFNVKDVGELEEMVVGLDMAKGMKLLKESLQSKTVLTNVFLCNSAAQGSI